MEQTMSVRIGPQVYKCALGCWDYLEEYIGQKGYRKIFILKGEKSWAAVEAYVPKIAGAVFFTYNQSCTMAEVERVEQAFSGFACDCLVVVGGGKIADLGKMVANRLQIPIIILPTLVATCAAVTPLSVIYDQNGQMISYEIFNKQTDLVLLDPQIISQSPKAYFVAGIADTLAKWYEADVSLRQIPNPSLSLKLAHSSAKQCQEILLTQAKQAICDMEAQNCSAAFIEVCETNVFLSGLVGGFGDETARTSGAHAIHDALTLIADSHKMLHGLKVAYGILVQLRLEKRPEEIEKLLPWYQELNLPTNLEQILGREVSIAEIKAIASKACEEGSQIYLVNGLLTARDVEVALWEQEK
ncbi:MAG: iron-containing alcohol dehydrogenase family protein [Culicoidibacterales bacterium]